MSVGHAVRIWPRAPRRRAAGMGAARLPAPRPAADEAAGRRRTARRRRALRRRRPPGLARRRLVHRPCRRRVRLRVCAAPSSTPTSGGWSPGPSRCGRRRAGPGPRDLADVEALLPPNDAEAALVSVALMELGAVVCTARAPRCGACPVRGECAWALAGRPAYTGPRRPVQTFAGTDQQVRGRRWRCCAVASRSNGLRWTRSGPTPPARPLPRLAARGRACRAARRRPLALPA